MQGNHPYIQIQKREAAQWLKVLLGNGPVSAQDVRKMAAGLGIAKWPLERAKPLAGVRSRKVGDIWYWELTNENPKTQKTPVQAITPGPGKTIEFVVEAYRDEDGMWCARGIGVGVFTQGRDFEDFLSNLKAAFQVHLGRKIRKGVKVRLLLQSVFEF